MAVLTYRDPATGDYLPVSYGSGADGVHDTGFVEAFHTHAGMQPAGAYKQGRMVTIQGTMWMSNPVEAFTPYLVGTVSAGFRPLLPFNFLAIWLDGDGAGAIYPGYGYILTDGKIFAVSPAAFSMISSDYLMFNATYTLD